MQQALSSSKEQHIIQNLIHQYLPESFHEHITVEYIRSGVVSIWIDQQMWLSRFHYEKTTLLQQLRKNPKSAHIVAIDARIHPGSFKRTLKISPEVSKTPMNLSIEHQEMIKSMISTSDGLLKENLQKMLSTVKRLTKK